MKTYIMVLRTPYELNDRTYASDLHDMFYGMSDGQVEGDYRIIEIDEPQVIEEDQYMCKARHGSETVGKIVAAIEEMDEDSDD
jgi:hypothetical protein